MRIIVGTQEAIRLFPSVFRPSDLEFEVFPMNRMFAMFAMFAGLVLAATSSAALAVDCPAADTALKKDNNDAYAD